MIRTLVLCGTSFLASCSSLSPLGTARIPDAGTQTLITAATLSGPVFEWDFVGENKTKTGDTVPSIVVMYRRAFSHEQEIGFRTTMLHSIAIDYKKTLLQDSRFALAMDIVGEIGAGPYSQVGVTPLMASYLFDNDMELGASARIGYWRGYSGDFDKGQQSLALTTVAHYRWKRIFLELGTAVISTRLLYDGDIQNHQLPVASIGFRTAL